MIRQRVRIRFRKEGDLRLISHRDLVCVFERMFRRAGLRLSRSEGFHPKARMSFPSALGLGIRGVDEVMEFELSEEVSAQPLLAQLNSMAPSGLEIVRLRLLDRKEGKAQLEHLAYEFPVPAERREAVSRAIEQVMSQSSWLVERPGVTEPVDLRRGLDGLELDERTVRFRIRVARTASVRPREVLDALGLLDLESQGHYLTRTKVEIS